MKAKKITMTIFMMNSKLWSPEHFLTYQYRRKLKMKQNFPSLLESTEFSIYEEALALQTCPNFLYNDWVDLT